jgi:hypothetical protein
MKLKKSRKKPKDIPRLGQVLQVPLRCRCGGEPTKPKLINYCSNRWVIQCQVSRCFARNTGQGLSDTISGWNRLSTHFYR